MTRSAIDMTDEAAALARLAGAWKHALSPSCVEGLLQYGRLILEWNARINLTGAQSFADLIADHLPDVFAVARLTPLGARVIDVGSGGGLPALPFALLRLDCQLTLVEPRAKRVAFLRTAIRELNLRQVSVQATRAEALIVPPSFDVACSRATFSPAEWLKVGRRLVRPDGRLIVLATTPSDLDRTPELDRVVDQISYQTAEGRPRWAAAIDFSS